ncbi:MAG: hypothetical protein NVS1B9_06050 [Solirubrobacteraceae bacterium]
MVEPRRGERPLVWLPGEACALSSSLLGGTSELRLHEDADFQALLNEVVARRLDPATAAQRVLDQE